MKKFTIIYTRPREVAYTIVAEVCSAQVKAASLEDALKGWGKVEMVFEGWSKKVK